MGRSAFAFPTGARRLVLKNAHTGETFSGIYRDAHGPVPSAISDLTVFLRDFHADKCGPLDVGLLDILANAMALTGQHSATVLSAYRTPETNERLRRTMFGVAEQSQHLYGRAIDVTFDSRLHNVQQAALAMKQGGVGWYPNSHFIHLDSGPTRSWELDGAHFDRLLTADEKLQALVATPHPDLLPMDQQLERANAMAHQKRAIAQHCANPTLLNKRGCPAG